MMFIILGDVIVVQEVILEVALVAASSTAGIDKDVVKIVPISP